MQREAYYLEVPCLTLRDETEWIATIETDWNKLVGADQKLILDNWFNFVPPTEHPPIYGNGTAGEHIAEVLNLTVVHKLEQKEISGNHLHPFEGVNSK